MKYYWITLLFFYSAFAAAQPGRGELLYSTYCDGCHGAQLHWRQKKSATDWNSLVAEVGRWAANTRLEWSRDEVEAVALYLNSRYYRYLQPPR